MFGTVLEYTPRRICNYCTKIWPEGLSTRNGLKCLVTDPAAVGDAGNGR
jgi:hypothetical protein